MATTVNGGTRIAIDVATTVSRCPEYHLLVDVGLRRSSPSTEHLSPLIAARSHASIHAYTNGTHSGSSLLASRVVFPSFLLASRSHLVTRGIRANEVPPFSLFYLPLSFCYLSFSRLARQWLNTNYTIYTTNNRRKRKVIFFLCSVTLHEEPCCPSSSTPRKASRHFPTVLIGPAYYPSWPTEREISHDKEKSNSEQNDSLTIRWMVRSRANHAAPTLWHHRSAC